MTITFHEAHQPGIFGVEIDGKFAGFAEARGDDLDTVRYFWNGYTELIPSIYDLARPGAKLTGLLIMGSQIPPLSIRLAESGDGLVIGNGLIFKTRLSGNRICLRETQRGLDNFLSKLLPLVDWDNGEFREPVTVAFRMRENAMS